MSDILITSAARTPIGTLGGTLASVSAVELGRMAISSALERAQLAPDDVSDVIMGQILSAGAGMNPARQSAIAAGLPFTTTAMTVNQVCGSGLRSVALGMQAIKTGDSEIVVAGGQENMSLSPHCLHLRSGTKLGDAAMVDTMLNDALVDAFGNIHMGETAENIAEQWQITRDAQDAFAAHSQQKAEAAQKANRFDAEIIPVTYKTRKGDVTIDQDEHPRHGTTPETLAGLKPAFRKNGTVTAGNASGINDGAAAVVLMASDNPHAKRIQPLGRIVSWATAGVSPDIMGTGPIPASQQALAKAGWHVDQLDLIESNEAFAAQAIAVNREMGWDESKVNVNGGAIALGHPVGASGTRILVTLLHEMKRRDAKRGLATLCIGGGMGIALCVARD